MSLIYFSINRLKSHILFLCKNFMFSDFTWNKHFCSRKWWSDTPSLALPPFLYGSGKSTAKLPTINFKSHSRTRRTTTSCYTTNCAKSTAKSATTTTWATKRCKRRWREKKRKHEIDGLMIKVNVSLIYGVKNKISWTLIDVIKLGVAPKLK